MSRTLRLVAFLVGAVVLALLIREVGVDTLAEGARTVGWFAVPIMALHAVVYGLNAVAWYITLATSRAPHRSAASSDFRRRLRDQLPHPRGQRRRRAIPDGGAHAVARARKAAGSVLQYAMLHALSSLFMWLTAIVAALTLPGVHGRIWWALLAMGGVIVAALGVVRSGHRHGFVARLAGWIARRRLGRLSAWLTKQEEALVAVDAQITSLHAEQPGRLGAAIAVDYLSRWVAMGELLLVAYAVGTPLGITPAVMISGLSALAVNLFFLLPWEMGSREGSLYLLFGLAGVPASLGLIAAVMTRLREIVWCALGLALAGPGGRAAAAEARAGHTTPPAA
ncbi:MAG: flippase-like domain-containing protein [Gemmatimonadetes bacterium]|nr:flippase-like domain-containing protein [Gemmatimonadota bacterium]